MRPSSIRTLTVRQHWSIVLRDHVHALHTCATEPVLKHYAGTAIAGLSADYGTEPIFYIVTEYDEANASAPGEGGWYIKAEEKAKSGTRGPAASSSAVYYPHHWRRTSGPSSAGAKELI